MSLFLSQSFQFWRGPSMVLRGASPYLWQARAPKMLLGSTFCSYNADSGSPSCMTSCSVGGKHWSHTGANPSCLAQFGIQQDKFSLFVLSGRNAFLTLLSLENIHVQMVWPVHCVQLTVWSNDDTTLLNTVTVSLQYKLFSFSVKLRSNLALSCVALCLPFAFNIIQVQKNEKFDIDSLHVINHKQIHIQFTSHYNCLQYMTLHTCLLVSAVGES